VRMLVPVLALAALGALAGCDPVYGVIRQASKLRTEPTPE
jgi:hypothetical protein